MEIEKTPNIASSEKKLLNLLTKQIRGVLDGRNNFEVNINPSQVTVIVNKTSFSDDFQNQYNFILKYFHLSCILLGEGGNIEINIIKDSDIIKLAFTSVGVYIGNEFLDKLYKGLNVDSVKIKL